MKTTRSTQVRLWMGVIISALLLLAACEEAPQQTATPSTPPVEATDGIIVCMGDSLTAGYGVDEVDAYPALLEDRLRKTGYRYQVINVDTATVVSA